MEGHKWALLTLPATECDVHSTHVVDIFKALKRNEFSIALPRDKRATGQRVVTPPMDTRDPKGVPNTF
ncbi:hypothetical protein EVAR_64326_1 [Eumeta japonica]|uniref:Uncharacterized protein n=1 Tax=Eumeta variegata TaxID=151549 RepID=A0A4C1ZEG8_EUMVA|nr:hypothetical protein EVAR_64326_1 [Eumeta japonica]